MFGFELEDSKVSVWPKFVDDESLANSVRSVFDSWSRATCRLSAIHLWHCMDLYSVGSADRLASSTRNLSPASLASAARTSRMKVALFKASRWSSWGSCWVSQCWKDSANACSEAEYRANRRRRRSFSFTRIHWAALIAAGKDANGIADVLEVTSILKMCIRSSKWKVRECVTSYTSIGIGGVELRSWYVPIQKNIINSILYEWNRALYLEDMRMLSFPIHLARENIEQLVSTNGVSKSAGSVK